MSEPHARRRQALRSRMHECDLDALLVTNLLNIRYLTGFTGSNAAVLVHASDEHADGDGAEPRTLLCTDGRYEEHAANEVADLTHLIHRSSDTALVEHAGRHSAEHERVGFESQHVTVDDLDTLTTAAGSVELVRAPGLVEQLRSVKDEAEVAALRSACAVGDRAFADLLEHGGVRPGRTERDVARELEARMLDHGAAGPAFPTITAAGAHSAIPHHRPTDAVLAAGDFVKMDFGALVSGYHSDMTRTVVLGEPAQWQRELYDLVFAAQKAGREELMAGARASEVDAAARQVISDAGCAEQFSHGLGHGVGLEIHEAPALSTRAEGKIVAGMAVTVEPGVYLTGRGGVRIEDTLIARPSTPELLTLTTKELIAV